MFRLVIQARKNISKYCANKVKYAQKIFGIENILFLYPSFYTEVIEKIMTQQDDTTDG